ncbi:MAG: L-glyceraldehyde 3-phosphate reductase [Clostridiales bacterium]|nr:L-glyceraldehyde 3-phosphate reductase [Clostridiales bacterium]
MYVPNESRYEKMKYNRCGKSGLKLPAVSLGLWQNFGYNDSFANMENMCHTAFDLGVTHFDLANNYGNPHNGSAEENFKKILDRGMREFRDELCISTKAGYDMWKGPYGDKNGSRKYLVSSLDQSLKRMGLDYVDIFYHHINDPDTPVEETALALDHITKQGKALYVGISNYNTEQTKEIQKIFKELRTPFILNQPSYSMLNRWIETDGLRDYAKEDGFGLAVFSPLYQGLLTDRYLNGIPEDSRIGKGNTWIKNELTPKMLEGLNKLNDVAKLREQSLAQMALSWTLREDKVTTVLIGASRPEQIVDNVQAAYKTEFSQEQLNKIEDILNNIR